ncbi:DUF948 domain-containing protein [Nitrospira sp. NS4]|uniref:DUF948 domain-containing protein n=1 Tax=Nitrospira sp. NS4 TaxID=3414498 RepID=UPI003C2D45F5
MTIVEMAAILIAVAFAVLVGYLVPVLIQVRKTVAESEQLLAKMNAEMPPLIADLRAMSQNLNDLADQARGGVEHAAVLLHAVGEVGESVQYVHDVVRGSGGTLLTNVASMVAGFKAASQVVRERWREEGGHHNGG